MLYIVPTPIGNLGDITLRALEVLKQVDKIICEDTRRISILLNHFSIKKPLLVLNDFNEKIKFPQIIQELKIGTNMALVSDAGTPLISDPGYKLVREAFKENIPVDSLPGPTAITVSLTLSSLPPDKFMFLGYLPEKEGHRRELLNKIKTISNELSLTYVIYLSPHKLIKTLEGIKEVLGNIEIVLEKELTKIHQEVLNDSIENILDQLNSKSIKGEYVLLFNLTKTS